MALLYLFLNVRTSLIFFYETLKRTKKKPKQKLHVKVTVQREEDDTNGVKYLLKVQGDWINIRIIVSLQFETFYEAFRGKIYKSNNGMDQKYVVDCNLPYSSKISHTKMILGTEEENRDIF